MLNIQSLVCVRCRHEYEAGERFKGCQSCAAEGKPSNLEPTYDPVELTSAAAMVGRGPVTSMWHYRELLPVDDSNIVTLGEGGTPLLRAPRLGARLRIPNLYLKDESRNPSGSFKDRLAAGAVSAARQLGKRVVTGSSSGNAGAAVAALSARAGIPCVMFTASQFPQAMKVQMGVYGTYLLAAPTVKDRWALVEAGVDQLGWFPITVFSWPYFGSNFYGIEGYKTIGYEIADQGPESLDHVVFPVGAGDAFSGAYRGFRDYVETGRLDRLPKMHAAEIYGPLEHALAEGLDYVPEMTADEPSVAVSVASTLSTYQALDVLLRTGGRARRADNAALVQAQRDIAALEGLFVEASSALSVAVLPKLLRDGVIDPGDTVVAVLTSNGLKDPDTTAAHMPPVPTCGAELDSALQALNEHYGYTAR